MIGIVGGYGDVGRHVAKTLLDHSLPIRIGGRNALSLRQCDDEMLTNAEWTNVDITDEKSVRLFIADCDLIVNCVGPSYRTSARLAEICWQEGVNLVDAGYDPRMDKMRELRTSPTVSIVYAAGTSPGLTGLLPRWMARSYQKLTSLVVYYGGLGKFTKAAAEDYLAGMENGYSEPLAAWKEGAKRTSALSRQTGIMLPSFVREVGVYPYFDAEAAFVARSIGIDDGEWYLAVDGERMLAALPEARAMYGADSEKAANMLCQATALDAAGRSPYMNILVQMSGVDHGGDLTRTLLLNADSPTRLTGTTVAATALAIRSGAIPPGICPLSEIPDPVPVMTNVQEADTIKVLNILPYSIQSLLQEVEGEL